MRSRGGRGEEGSEHEARGQGTFTAWVDDSGVFSLPISVFSIVLNSRS